MSYFWIFLGSGLGGVARFGASGFIARQFGESFPWGTLLMMGGGLVTLEKARVIEYRAGPEAETPPEI